MPLNLQEKRQRNRSLCTLYTPPPYPGYTATLATIRAEGQRKCSFQAQNHCNGGASIKRVSASSSNILDPPPLSQSLSESIFSRAALPGSPSWRGVIGHSSLTPESPYRRTNSRSPASPFARFNLISPVDNDDSLSIQTNGSETTFGLNKQKSGAKFQLANGHCSPPSSTSDTYRLDASPSSCSFSTNASLAAITNLPNPSDVGATVQSLRDRRLANRTSQPSSSSGYASHCSESSELEETTNAATPATPVVVMRARPASRAAKRRMFERRRQSVPANLRDIYSDEIVRVLAQDGFCLPCGTVNFSQPGPAEGGISHDTPVIQLSREYSQVQAQQDRHRHKMGTIAEIDHTDELNRMLETCDDPDQKKAIRSRIIELRHAERAAKDKRLSELENSSQQRIKDKVTEGNRLKARTLATFDEIQKTGKLNMETYKGTAEPVVDHKHEEPSHPGKYRRDKENSLPSGTKSGPSSPTGRADEAKRISAKPVGGIAALSESASSPGPKSHVASQMSSSRNYFKINDSKMSNGSSPGGSSIVAKGNSKREALVRWCAYKTKEYPAVNIVNMSSSWADGMAFCALIHHYYPDAFNFDKLNPANRKHNLALAFKTAEDKADIVPLLEVEDMLEMGDKPDWKCIFTYVQSFYQRFKDED